MRNTFQLPPNVKVKLRPMNGGKKFRWEITQWGKVLGEGGPFREREKAAENAWEALGKLLAPKVRSNADKAYLKQRLLYWTKSRPYVVMHVVERLIHGGTRSDCVRDARTEELRLWGVQEGVVGRPDIPTHGRAKHAGEVAASCFDIMTKLGLVGKKADRWATRVIGMAYSAPEEDRHYEMDDLETPEDQKLAQDFDDDENAMTRDTPV